MRHQVHAQLLISPVLHWMVSGRCPCVHDRRCGSGLMPRHCTQLPFHWMGVYRVWVRE